MPRTGQVKYMALLPGDKAAGVEPWSADGATFAAVARAARKHGPGKYRISKMTFKGSIIPHWSAGTGDTEMFEVAS